MVSDNRNCNCVAELGSGRCATTSGSPVESTYSLFANKFRLGSLTSDLQSRKLRTCDFDILWWSLMWWHFTKVAQVQPHRASPLWHWGRLVLLILLKWMAQAIRIKLPQGLWLRLVKIITTYLHGNLHSFLIPQHSNIAMFLGMWAQRVQSHEMYGMYVFFHFRFPG